MEVLCGENLDVVYDMYVKCLQFAFRNAIVVVLYYDLLLDLYAGQYGKWSTDSCRVVSDDGATTQCVCTQLGHFGLLFVSKVCNSVPCRLHAFKLLTKHSAFVAVA